MSDAPAPPKRSRSKIYEESFCDRVIELAKLGRTPAEWAAEFGVAYDTLYKWRERYPEFVEAYDIAMTAWRGWLEREALEGMNKGRQFNAMVFTKLGHVYARQAYNENNAPNPERRDGEIDAQALGRMTLEEIEAKEREVVARQEALRAALADAKARMRDEA